MKIIKKFFLAITLLCCAGVVSAHDFSNGDTGVELYFNIIGKDSVEITFGNELLSSPYSGDIVIPGTVTHNQVTYQVTRVGDLAFLMCPNLTSVIIPEGVTRIGGQAFWNCTSLETISIPTSVTSIGGGAIVDTPWFNNLPDGPFYIGNILFAYCGTIMPNSTITVKDGTTKIASYAFQGQLNDFSVQLPESVTEIEESVFSNSGLTAVNLPSGITTITGFAFAGCTKLASIDLQHITQLENYAFIGCSALTSVDLPENVTLGVNVFENSGLTSVTIPGSWESTGKWTFAGCKNLQSVVLSEGVETIGMHSFYGCEVLNAVSLPSSLKTIGDCAFRDCKGFTSFTIPANVTSVGRLAFAGCVNLEEFTTHLGYFKSMFDPVEGVPSKLTKVTITAPCTEIDFSAFYNCNYIEEVNLPEGLLSIGGYAFSGCLNLKPMTIPNTVETIGDGAFRDCGFTSIELSENLTSMGAGIFSGCEKLTAIHIPEKITKIPGNAFDSCLVLATVTMSDNVTEIEWNAFESCEKLKNFTFPSKLETIGDWAFKSCYEFPNLNIPAGVTSIGEEAFANCSTAVSVSIPNGLESLSSRIFENCSKITTVTIPKSITSMDFAAFLNCNGLQEVTVEWEKPLEINENVFLNVETSDCVLKVPAGTKELYLADEVWSTFMIEEYEITGIGAIAVEKEKTVAGYFNLLGQKLSEKPANGLYVILYNDGTSEKAIVK